MRGTWLNTIQNLLHKAGVGKIWYVSYRNMYHVGLLNKGIARVNLSPSL